MRLLIADDDLTSRTILAAVARKWGYDSITVEDGEQAWNQLQQTDPPLLLLIDWEMPKLDGLGLCQRIRKIETKVPPYIILLTSRGDVDDVVTGLEAGANDYIVKPFENAELKARLQVGMRMLELQAELKSTQDGLSYEKELIENIILKMRLAKPFEATSLRQLDKPVEKISGDIVLSVFTPNNTRYVLVGDFTGHGVVAAVGGPMVFDVFYTMAAKGIALSEIAGEINQQLLVKMPTGLFLSATFIELKPDGKTLSVWNCGMSDVLLYHNAILICRIKSQTLALGIVEQNFDTVEVIEVDRGDKVYAFSDGITEIINLQGQEYGQDKLEQKIVEMLIKGEDIDFLWRQANQFSEGAKQFDDVTLVELTC